MKSAAYRLLKQSRIQKFPIQLWALLQNRSYHFIERFESIRCPVNIQHSQIHKDKRENTKLDQTIKSQRAYCDLIIIDSSISLATGGDARFSILFRLLAITRSLVALTFVTGDDVTDLVINLGLLLWPPPDIELGFPAPTGFNWRFEDAAAVWITVVGIPLDW